MMLFLRSYLFNCRIEPVAFKEFDSSLIALLCEVSADRKLSKYGDTVLFGDFFNVAVAVYLMLLAAVGTFVVAHILDDAEYRDIHELRHFNSLLDNHGNEFLRRGNYNDAVNGDRL